MAKYWGRAKWQQGDRDFEPTIAQPDPTVYVHGEEENGTLISEPVQPITFRSNPRERSRNGVDPYAVERTGRPTPLPPVEVKRVN